MWQVGASLSRFSERMVLLCEYNNINVCDKINMFSLILESLCNLYLTTI